MKIVLQNRSVITIDDGSVKKAKKKDKFVADHLILFTSVGFKESEAKEKLSETWDSQHPQKKEE